VDNSLVSRVWTVANQTGYAHRPGKNKLINRITIGLTPVLGLVINKKFEDIDAVVNDVRGWIC
jgi:hypothetical protein